MITRTYRNYNEEYVSILNDYPNKMDNFYNDFEAEAQGVFKRYPESQRARILELYTKETEAA